MEGGGSYKLKWSNFHVTVNANAPEDAMGTVRDLRRGVENMVLAKYMWEWLKRFDGSQRVDMTSEYKFLVQRVRIRAALEQGGQTNKSVHVHMVIEVAHRTMVQIDKYGVQDIFQRTLGWVPNVDVRFIQGRGEDKSYILKYITKEVPRTRPESQLNDQLRYAFAKGDVIEADNTFPV